MTAGPNCKIRSSAIDRAWSFMRRASRSFDPQLGRFFQIDPMADQYHSLTTYQYAGDNPVLTNDPTGANLPRNITHGESGDNPTAEIQAVDESYGEEDAGNEPFYGGGGGGGGSGGGSPNGDDDSGTLIYEAGASGDLGSFASAYVALSNILGIPVQVLIPIWLQ